MGFAFVGSGNAGDSHGSHAKKFADQGHGVGSELTTTCACTRTGGTFNFLQFLVTHLAARVCANGFKYILDGDGVAFELARCYGATVENQAGNIQTGERHDAAGNGFVATDKNDDAVEKIAAGDKFDGVRNDFTADQRGAHTFGAHGDAIGDRDRVEFQGGATSGANALTYVLGKFAKVIIARANFRPGVGDTDERLGEIFVFKPGGAKHGAGRGAVSAVGKCGTAGLQQAFGHRGPFSRDSKNIGA